MLGNTSNVHDDTVLATQANVLEESPGCCLSPTALALVHMHMQLVCCVLVLSPHARWSSLAIFNSTAHELGAHRRSGNETTAPGLCVGDAWGRGAIFGIRGLLLQESETTSLA